MLSLQWHLDQQSLVGKFRIMGPNNIIAVCAKVGIREKSIIFLHLPSIHIPQCYLCAENPRNYNRLWEVPHLGLCRLWGPFPVKVYINKARYQYGMLFYIALRRVKQNAEIGFVLPENEGTRCPSHSHTLLRFSLPPHLQPHYWRVRLLGKRAVSNTMDARDIVSSKRHCDLPSYQASWLLPISFAAVELNGL